MVISQLEITMNPIHSLHPLARAWLLDGPLSPHVDAYLALLERGSYSEGSTGGYVRALAHFAHWIVGSDPSPLKKKNRNPSILETVGI